MKIKGINFNQIVGWKDKSNKDLRVLIALLEQEGGVTNFEANSGNIDTVCLPENFTDNSYFKYVLLNHPHKDLIQYTLIDFLGNNQEQEWLR